MDRGRALVLDQLFADGPHERLERLRSPRNAQPGVGTHRAPDQRIESKSLIERPQVLVDPERESHPLDPPFGGVAVLGLGPEQDPISRQLGDPDRDRLSAGVQEAVQDTVAGPRESVEADAPGEPERPPRPDLDPDLDPAAGRQSPGFAIRWTSTRNDRVPAI